MQVRRALPVSLLVILVLTSVASAAGKHSWSDSVFTQAASSNEASLQEVLNTLGYSIDVENDELSLSTFVTPAGLNRAVIELKHAGSSYASPVGWYPVGDSAARSEILAGASSPGDAADFSLSDGFEFGLYLGQTLFDDFWFSEEAFNWDNFDHAKVYAAGDPNTYVLAWEDLPNGGDQDFQDAVIELRFTSADALNLSFTGETFYLFCTEDFVCFEVTATGGSGNLTLYLVEEGTPTEVASGPSPLTYEHCFLPWPVDSIHTFAFRVEDEAGDFDEDEFAIEIKMNSRPELFVAADQLDTTICDLDSICFDVLSATDIDGDEITFSLISGQGSIDPVSGEICFLPDDVDSADYSFVVQAADSCCASFYYDPLTPVGCPRDTIVVTVHKAPQVIISTIEDTAIFLCELVEICFPVTATADGEPAVVQQDCGPGTLVNDQLCFTPTAEGVYQFCFFATNVCGTVRDTVTITIDLNEPPVAFAGNDSTFHCTSGEVCWPAYCTDPDDNLVSCELIAGPGIYANEQICFTAPSSGTYQFVLEATDDCQAVDLDTVTITIDVGNPPVAYVGDSTLALCEPAQVCIPAWCDDPDNDLVSCEMLEAPPGASFAEPEICFTPAASGTYEFVLRATDACGSEDYDTGTVVVDLNTGPQVNPGGGDFTLCEPDTICIPVNVTDPDGDHIVTSTMGQVVNNNTVCIYSGEQEGSRQIIFDVIATDTCGLADTAEYVINLRLNMPPIIQVPTPAPDSVCEGEELCFDVDALDSVITDLVFRIIDGEGTIDPDGVVCFEPTNSQLYVWHIEVSDSCGIADTGEVDWSIYVYPPPTPVVAPPDGDTTLCYGNPVDEICVDLTYDAAQAIAGIWVTADPLDIDWSYDFSGGSGQICFTPRVDTSETYQFTIQLTDSCNAYALTTYNHTVSFVDCDTTDCLTLAIEQTECVTLGSVVSVDIVLSEGLIPIGGYDLLITYDVTAFAVLAASIGTAINGWEYFTWRLGPFSNCGGACPSGLIRLVAIADINNGSSHPPVEQLLPDGVVATIAFRVTTNTSFAGFVYPVKFYWWDCGDNGIATASGDTLLVDRLIYDPEYLLWDEDDDVNFPEASRYMGLGVPDSCIEGDKTRPLRCVTFINGSICIIHNDSIDVRGDVNLNGLAYEISDAVLFTNYFLKGITVFHISVAGQTAATDINNDGMPLTIGDLIYLIRVITGDALPIPKLSPYGEEALLSLEPGANSLAVYTHSGSDLGGVFFEIDLNGIGACDVIESFAADGVLFKYEVRDGIMRLLIYGQERGAKIPAGKVKLFELDGAVDVEIIHAEASDYYGNLVDLKVEKASLPTGFALAQNYPNPFNPKTDIEMYFPYGSEWSLTIFNVNGQVIRQFEGSASAGVATVTWDGADLSGRPVATGVYFYRMEADRFTDTKKMLLLK